MPKYYVNKSKQKNGRHQVHREGCDCFPEPQNLLELGRHRTCHGAVRKARKRYKNASGCYYCSRECYSR